MIFVTGDTHIPHDVLKLGSHRFVDGRSLSKTDYVIVCGDFGLLWDAAPSNQEHYWTQWLTEKGWTTLFIAGNHENYNRLCELPVIDKFGGRVGVVNDGIYYLGRGEVYSIDGKTFFCFGGALSTDKDRRVENRSWWKDEIPSVEDVQRATDNLTRHSNKVDYVIAHTLPRNKIQQLMAIYNLDIDFVEHGLANPARGYIDGTAKTLVKKFHDPTASMLEHLMSKLQFDHYYCGHFHDDKDIDSKHRILFEDILKIV